MSSTVLILAWAVEHFALLDGECLLSGVDLLALPFARRLNVVAAMILRGVSSEEERERMRGVLEDGDPIVPTSESWGTSRAAISALAEARKWSAEEAARDVAMPSSG